MKNLQINFQKVSAFQDLPTLKQIKSWIKKGLEGQITSGDLTIRITTTEEIQKLNKEYRHKDKPTNILSFNYSDDPEEMVGDLVICDEVVKREAVEQHKTYEQHYAHLIIHGLLHLRGYDHETHDEAEEMEALEIKLLQDLGFPNPYLIKIEEEHAR